MSKFYNCNNVNDFRKLAKKKLPFPVFHYIDGGADDEITLKRNVESFDKCDLVSIIKLISSFDWFLYSGVIHFKPLNFLSICSAFFERLIFVFDNSINFLSSLKRKWYFVDANKHRNNKK